MTPCASSAFYSTPSLLVSPLLWPSRRLVNVGKIYCSWYPIELPITEVISFSLSVQLFPIGFTQSWTDWPPTSKVIAPKSCPFLEISNLILCLRTYIAWVLNLKMIFFLYPLRWSQLVKLMASTIWSLIAEVTITSRNSDRH